MKREFGAGLARPYSKAAPATVDAEFLSTIPLAGLSGRWTKMLIRKPGDLPVPIAKRLTGTGCIQVDDTVIQASLPIGKTA